MDDDRRRLEAQQTIKRKRDEREERRKNQKMEKIRKMILEVNSMTLVKKVSSMETILS